MDKTNSQLVLRILKKMATPMTQMESYKTGVINEKGDVIIPRNKRTRIQERSFTMIERLVIGLKKSSNPMAYVSAMKLMKEYVEDQSNETTSQYLFEKMEEHQLISSTPRKHDIGTYEGFMDAVDDMMSEMFSGAAIGGAFDGAQSNAAANATGMAAPNGPTKKKKKIDSILNRRF